MSVIVALRPRACNRQPPLCVRWRLRTWRSAQYHVWMEGSFFSRLKYEYYQGNTSRFCICELKLFSTSTWMLKLTDKGRRGKDQAQIFEAVQSKAVMKRYRNVMK